MYTHPDRLKRTKVPDQKYSYKMKSLGPWLLLLVVLVVLATEADAGRNKSTRKTRVKIKVKYTSKQKTRRGRSIEDTLTLPCDISEFDSDQDGSISETEWQNHFSEFNPILNSSEYVDYIIQQIDANGDGILQVSEFAMNTVYKKDCYADDPAAPPNNV